MPRFLSEPLKVDSLEIAIADLPASVAGTTFVQLSDLHYDGRCLDDALLIEAIEACNASEPDIAVLTGDYVTTDPDPIHQLARHLENLQTRWGTYAILGNHDIYYPHSRTEITDALVKVGIQVLWNQVVYPLGPDLALVGLADFWSGEFKPNPVFDQIPDTTARVVLSHNPDTAAILKKWRVDLQLSGHTHGGQIVLPKVGPLFAWLNPLRKIAPKPLRPWIPGMSDCYKVVDRWEWSEGLHQVNQNWLYVNRGLGSYRPGRFRCPPEVTVVTLVPDQTTVSPSTPVYQETTEATAT